METIHFLSQSRTGSIYHTPLVELSKSSGILGAWLPKQKVHLRTLHIKMYKLNSANFLALSQEHSRKEGYCCPGSLHRQDISSNGIHFVGWLCLGVILFWPRPWIPIMTMSRVMTKHCYWLTVTLFNGRRLSVPSSHKQFLLYLHEITKSMQQTAARKILHHPCICWTDLGWSWITWGLMTYICVNEISDHCFWCWLVVG